MLIIVSLLLVTMALSIVMLLVLSSLQGSGARGIRKWSAGNAMAVLALPLFAARGKVPDILSIEVANTLLLGTTTMMLAGFRRHLGLALPVRRLCACVLLGLLAIVVLHHGIDSAAWRMVAMSILHGALCLEMGALLLRHALLRPALRHTVRRYPVVFTACAAFGNAAVQLVRAFTYGAQAAGVALPWDDATLGMVFFSAGALSLPVLTLGAVMMANAELVARARHAADHDHLTGARSRRAFFDLAARERARSLRGGAPLSLLLFDVDHFKRINDTYGHATGDRVLVEIIQRTGASVRSIDIVARLGGEEFAVLLPDTGAEAALEAAERLRSGLARALDGGAGSIDVSYTVSIGAATLDSDESIDGMLSRADAALYAAKARGRNAVVDARELVAVTA
jgi:diguanylate cyclase (GGDEF)-like protein